MNNSQGSDGRLVLGIDASRANSATRTGTEWYAYHVIQGLKKLVPDNVRVVLYSREPLRDGLEVLPENWESRVLSWTGLFWTQLRLSAEMIVRPPDVLFVPAHTLPVVCPRKVVTTLHDVGFLSVPDAYSFGERVYHRLATRFAAWRAEKILTVSEFSRSEIVGRYGLSDNRVAVTHLACDRSSFRVDLPERGMNDAMAEYGMRAPYFLFTGRLERKKNLGVLLAAFSEYVLTGGAAQLVLVGKRGLGAEEAFATLNEKVRAQVIETGYVAGSALPFLYAGAAAYLFPSRYEGFGIPLLEAFACGVPVAASGVTSIPEVAGEAALFVPPDDVNGWAKAMKQILADKDLRDDLTRAGLERVEQFSWSKTVEQTWTVLEEVIRR